MELGEYVSKYRKQAELTIDELALLSGVPKGTINKIIAGTTKSPTLETVQALAKALGKTINDFIDAPQGIKKESTSDLSDAELSHIKKYRTLDEYGKGTVDIILDRESKRLQAEAERRRLAPVQPSDTRFIPLYYTPSAAGYTEPAAGQDFDYIEVGPEVPRRADCAIRISGKSMEPHIKDGSIVYVSREPIEIGDVGIFYVDGDMLCKQYYRDAQGRVFLLSLNRDCADADRVIHPKDTDTVLTYYGKVLLDFRPRIVV